MIAITRSLSLLAALTAAIGSAGFAASTDDAVFPFVLPWDDAFPGITDVSGWLDQPAGGLGRVRAGDDGHFYVGTRRLRFLGVNMSFAGGMPTREDGEKVAGRLAKFGVNVVRFHHMDTAAWPGGLRRRDARGTGEIDPEALDRLCAFIANLKARGIYANINLLVGRPFDAGDGLPPEIEEIGWKERAMVGFFDEAHRRLQQAFARRLLTHRNPHTGLTLAEDPAVAFVEINNENGLIHAWLAHDVDALPPVFLETLRAQWNEWLKARYVGEAQWRSAWRDGEEPEGAELLEGQGRRLEQHGEARAAMQVREDAEGETVRLEVAQPGSEAWHAQFTQGTFPLTAGESYTLSFRARSQPARDVAVSISQAHEPWGPLGLSARVALNDDWKKVRLVFNAGASDDRARVTLSDLGPAGSRIDVANLSLRPGGVRGIRDGETLRSQSVPAFQRRRFGERTAAAQRDWIRFLWETEERYWQSMRDFLKEELQVNGLITGTIVGCTTPNLAARMDWVDTHAYWQHPRFPGRPWDPGHWIVENRSMVNTLDNTLPRLALKRVAGRPHAVTEYNHAAPNTFGSEAFLLLAAYAALQDWDAIYVYSYAHHRATGWDLRRFTSHFDIDQHPAKMATLPAAAAMFRRGDIRPAEQLTAVPLTSEMEIESLRRAAPWSLVDAGTLGVPRETVFVRRVALITDELEPGVPAETAPGRAGFPTGRFTGFSNPVSQSDPAKSPNATDANFSRAIPASPPPALPAPPSRPNSPASPMRLVSDTGQLVWDLSQPGRGVVTVDTPRTKAVIGYGGGRRFALGDVIVEPGATLQDGWCAITLVKMDTSEGEGRTGAPQRWLLTATGYTDNTGMDWKNEDRSTVGRDWGRAPTRAEGVPARVTVKTDTMRVWALDERGGRKAEITPTQPVSGMSQVSVGPASQTLWYELQVP